MRAVRNRAAREAIDPDVHVVEVVEDRVEQLERPREVRPALPAPPVVRLHPAVAEHLDGEAEPVGQESVQVL
jgi:hypothetical protein